MQLECNKVMNYSDKQDKDNNDLNPEDGGRKVFQIFGILLHHNPEHD
jgi:hypothetical protein